jgi:hypothetical protein
MRVASVPLALLLAAAPLAAQSKPVPVSAACSVEVVNNLALPCTEDEPCPLFLELAGAEQVGPRLIVTGSIHTGSATLESVLLSSDDGGRTWTEPHPRLPGAVLDQIQFFDFEGGWINGHLLSGVPRDPFFLLTTDGGKTWRRRPIHGESRTGAVEQFWFESRTHGTLSLDRVRAAENGMRYEAWESMTGGESWNIRQVDSRPIPFRRPPREPLVRITADGKAKVHRLERREGEAWALVATFDISAGQCRPHVPEPVAEPPTAQATPPPTAEPESAPTSPRKPPRLRKP